MVVESIHCSKSHHPFCHKRACHDISSLVINMYVNTHILKFITLLLLYVYTDDTVCSIIIVGYIQYLYTKYVYILCCMYEYKNYLCLLTCQLLWDFEGEWFRELPRPLCLRNTGNLNAVHCVTRQPSQLRLQQTIRW